MLTTAVIVAGGQGVRASRGAGLPKQYARIGGKPVLAWTLDAFCGHPRVDVVQVVINADHEEAYAAVIRGLAPAPLPPVVGGATRQASVLAGLMALRQMAPDLVLIHDAARPFVESAVIDRVINVLAQREAAIAALAVADTLKRAGPDGLVAATVPRDGLWRAQTPQGFRFPAILTAHAKARDAGRLDFTDDAALAEWAGLAVALVPGSEANRKLTTAEDIDMADRELCRRVATSPDVRTGNGFDVHRFVEGDHVWLGGVRIPHTHRLDGHSDADVALHALTDALLGAIGDGDIGQHFPPSDARWKGAASKVFLADAARRVVERGGRIGNVDVTILCEAPRIGPHREAMRTAIAGILGIDAGRVAVKATTTEQLGFTGRREGIAAMATATVVLPG
ncbi:MAG: bifunctional 2-C-methyl-D-erythritol 4-phosphate cytidylyltransferase/2-C-methyl-D-erythritol 2,4-cyclodiphosphate synthase [Hyphomicrobiaceae bacterium]|nr:bifunctional 2-C-methyl-D-erythritol 4-phosphate cytidylyltransferase/2-C-methyl-D-erythritol 2,4-cyclodiphosphate synthase [Hyphomicrobiaceae bacterium]